MKSVLQEQQRSSALVALVTILFGAALVLWPNRSVSVICALLGGALLVSGLLYVVGWFAGKRRVGAPVYLIIPGVVLAGLGVWLMTSSQTVIALVRYVFGAVIIFHALLDIQGVMVLRKQKMPKWVVAMVVSGVTLLFGILILLDPLDTFGALVVLIGLALIFDGGSDLWLILTLRKSQKTYLAFLNEEPVESDGGQETEG